MVDWVWVPEEEDMAAKGLVLHLAMALDVVRLVTAMEVRDGVIIFSSHLFRDLTLDCVTL